MKKKDEMDDFLEFQGEKTIFHSKTKPRKDIIDVIQYFHNGLFVISKFKQGNNIFLFYFMMHNKITLIPLYSRFFKAHGQ